ncbi:MAG: hypothetical protein A3C90_03070 [Candidatus Magasanikbacteria bacterium RIFCSPHIGHO2_02_FULL_51_14]|uniref:NIF system FeS cluster assembly NifU N-terminal domain-containing protein n=1 Tax=Candidatus Magasanikbacteria bacterium RIFCSPHIGHO2_02_FULL_51_14 TaxID=1798683 RepID=A0A1F6MI36_9BACT|nr:MAG: hypothetical protein A3C90_03070 [Candidatus Magasanikbacteria bacterium RIFCSPHIGHO2_02_FULL_51_14]
MDEIYREYILDLYRNPLNKKTLADFDVQHREYNPHCGDDIEVFIKFDEDGRVADIGHQGTGCAISQAAVSLIMEYVKGKAKEEILVISDSTMIELLGIPISPMRMKCATLGLQAIRKGIEHGLNEFNESKRI